MYVPSDTLLLADVFKNFRDICLEIYKHDLAKLLSAPGLVWQAAFKKTKGGIYNHSIYRYAKANNKYMKNYDKNKESSYLQYWDVTNLYGLAMSQKFSVNTFEWIKDTSQFNKRKWWRIFSRSWCSVSWKITWTS